MRYTILGFNQKKVCAITKEVQINEEKIKIYKLDITDLVILQDIADFMNRKSIIKYTINEKIYFSITHKSILQDLPLLDIKKQALKDRIDKMCLLGLIEKQVVRNEFGTWIGYRLTDVYESLLYANNEEIKGVYQTTQGGCSELHGGGVVNYNPDNYFTIKESTIDKDKKIEDKSSKKEAKIESDEDEFVEKIYSLYPAKCPKRDMSLGKTYKDKERIHKLLRTYSREDIERVVKQEVNEKYGKCYMSNFSTFLNNFPDPNSLFGKEQESTSNSKEEDMMQKFLALTESEQAKILQLDAYQYHMLPASAKEGWMNNRKQFILQWFTENGQ